MKKFLIIAALFAAQAHAAPIDKQCAALAKVASVVVQLKADGAPEAEVQAGLKADQRVADAIHAVYTGATPDDVKADCLASVAPAYNPVRIGRTNTDANGAQSLADVFYTH